MKGFQSRLPAARWEEGLLCGNGTIGAMVMGWPKEETIYFTHEKLYAPFAPVSYTHLDVYKRQA